jgi:hypothetical protein
VIGELVMDGLVRFEVEVGQGLGTGDRRRRSEKRRGTSQPH